MASLIQLLVSGLATGAIYALIAVGFTPLWQTSQTINFAQGEFVMLPAFFVLAAMNLGAPFWVAVLVGIAVSVVILGKPFGIYLISMWAVLTLAAIGLNLTLGYAGQVSLAQGAFVGIGAYTVALLSEAGCPFAVAFIAAGFLCFVIGWLLGYPALRVQHHYLAFVTLAFTTLVFLLLRNEQWLTNGIYGINGITRPIFFGWSTAKPLHFYFFCLGTLAVLSLATWWMLHSPWAVLSSRCVKIQSAPRRSGSTRAATRSWPLPSARASVAWPARFMRRWCSSSNRVRLRSICHSICC
jgi:branched-chain amino acid transport system permease protein